MQQGTTVTLTLGNRVTCVDCGEDLDVLTTVRELFRFHPNGYQFMPTFQNGHWDGYIQMLQRGKVATGLALELLPSLKALSHVEIVDRRTVLELGDPNQKAWDNARSYQQDCYRAMVDASQTGGLILQSTGSGKTFVAGLYLSALRGRALFLVDELTLLQQAREAISDVVGEPVGVIGGGEFSPQRITVATVQTLNQKQRRVQVGQLQPDVVIIDEVHEAVNDRTWKILNHLKPKVIFGLTATLQMRKKAVKYQTCAMAGPVIYTYPLKEGIEQGFLAKGVVVRIHRSFGLDSKMLTFLSKDLTYEERIVDSEERNKYLAHLARRCVEAGHPTMVLVERIQHLSNLKKAIGHFDAMVLSGEAPKEVRTDAIRRMKRKELMLIFTNKILGKGIDIPNLEVTIDATGRPSHNQAQQRLGRNSRKSETKKGFIHFDIADKRMEATAERLKAYRRLKLPIVDVKGRTSPRHVLETAEKVLADSV